MKWRLAAVGGFVLCCLGLHDWQPCGVPIYGSPGWVCDGQVCKRCLAHRV